MKLPRLRAAEPPSYWLTRFVLLRGLGFVYAVAFFSLAGQLLPLLGSHGLLPVDLFVARRDLAAGGRLAAFLAQPGLFWWSHSDALLLGCCWLGVALSLGVLAGYANALVLLALWFLYLSFVQVGQLWFAFGWEMQLLETGFLAVFLCPLLDGRPFPRTPPPRAVIVLLRWLIFRVMLGAGLIKLRHDPCWRELTCLVYHYETQPIPHPGSWFYHQLPLWFQRLSVAFNHFVEVCVPFFVFGPQLLRRAAGALLVLFQLLLITTGNYSFLNWLTIVPALACFDDGVWRRLLPLRLVAAAERAAGAARPSRAHEWAVAALVAVVAVLSINPVANLLSPNQAMNRSFDRLDLVNTYGLFGGVGRVRHEIVIEGTRDRVIDAKTEWKEYPWKCKPGLPERRPCLVTPYHYRLDWLIWFAAMSDARRHPWVVHLMWKLLENDPGALSLLAENPFPDAPPRFVRAELYRYEFTRRGEATDAWWRRRRERSYVLPFGRGDPRVVRLLTGFGWLRDEEPLLPRGAQD